MTTFFHFTPSLKPPVHSVRAVTRNTALLPYTLPCGSNATSLIKGYSSRTFQISVCGHISRCLVDERDGVGWSWRLFEWNVPLSLTRSQCCTVFNIFVSAKELKKKKSTNIYFGWAHTETHLQSQHGVDAKLRENILVGGENLRRERCARNVEEILAEFL